MLNFNKEGIEQDGASIAKFFGLPEWRVEELMEEGTPIVQKLYHKEISTLEVASQLLELAQNEIEQAYLSFIAGSVSAQAIIMAEGFSKSLGDPISR